MSKGTRTAQPADDTDCSTARPPYRLVDMHCHLALMANADEVTADAAARSIAFFDTTVTPADEETAHKRFAHTPNVRVGVGLHPWYLADGRCDGGDADHAALAAAQSRFIGEVGLDFSTRYRGSFAAQAEAFELIMQTCAERPRPGRIISLHAVRSAGAVLDILERFDLAHSATCIFHWFSGTSDELTRARSMGCWFSINERMLASKKGREYARQIPSDRLLLETDAPPELGAPYSASAIEASLETVLDRLTELRGEDRDTLATHIAEASCKLLGL